MGTECYAIQERLHAHPTIARGQRRHYYAFTQDVEPVAIWRSSHNGRPYYYQYLVSTAPHRKNLEGRITYFGITLMALPPNLL